MLIHIALALRSDRDRRAYESVIGALPDVVPSTVPDRDALWRRLTKEDIDLVVAGIEVLPLEREQYVRSIRGLPDRPEIVVVGANDDPSTRARLLAAGCLAVMPAGLTRAVVREVLQALVARRRDTAIARIRAERPEERYGLRDFVSESPAMSVFLETARKLVGVSTSVLILGETGVGKERLARAIHVEGPRAAGPFVALNCGALSESLLESELFGHEEGAFTGAHRARKGFLELAHGGTLFLDEIGDMPANMQVKLLRVLDEQKVYRVGAEKPLAIDVRVMAATNRDLEAEVAARRFREDLFYRLAVVTLRVPPLRDRRADIPELSESYLLHFSLETGRRPRRFSDETMKFLLEHDWPGNVRELINAVERAVLLSPGPEIDVCHLPRRITGAANERDRGGEGRLQLTNSPDATLLDVPLREGRHRVVASFERDYLQALLSSTGGRIGDAAHRAGVSERTLHAMMKRHGLAKETYRKRSGVAAARQR